jgi:hypothetical protein
MCYWLRAREDSRGSAFCRPALDDHGDRLVERPALGLRKSLLPLGATRGGAETLGEAHEIGILQVGRDDPASLEILLHAPDIPASPSLKTIVALRMLCWTAVAS